MEIINFKKKKMKLLAKEQDESYENANISCICKEKFENKYIKDKKYHKVGKDKKIKNIRSLYYTGEYREAAHSIYNLKYSIPEKIPVLS